jgi:Domain of unknown function (DUF4278)
MKFTKLCYRGNAYEVPSPIQSDAKITNQPKIKLIYRGHIYYVTPRPVVEPTAIAADEPTVTLIYRGNTYQRKRPSLPPYQTPRALNCWQFS